MSKLIIAAIPEQDDFTWQVSSEKVPHITLLFLGDADTNQHSEEIVQFVEHAVTTISPFYMDASHRGTLGEHDADVIFFEKGWDFKAVKAFRDQLLTNTYIQQAHSSTEQFLSKTSADQQFPEWTPHLTLGYPKTPAKKPEHDRRIHSVSFDRIAVWFGDYEGPEFRLERKVYDTTEVSMGSMSREEAEELLHFGTKGMKWGVVKAKLGTGVRAVGKGLSIATVAIADSHWRGSVNAPEKQAIVHNAVSEKLNGDNGGIARLNASPKYRGKNLEADAKLKVEYHQDFAKVTDRAHRLAVNDIYGTNYSGTQKAEYVNDVNGPRIEVRDIDAKHAADDIVVIRLRLDKDGKIVEANKAVSNTLAQADSDVVIQGEEFTEGLLHYGVKGMKWGQRSSAPTPGGKRLDAYKEGVAKKNAIATTPKAVTVQTSSSQKGKAKIKTKGGEFQPPSADAISAKKLAQQRSKSGLDSLSNKELKTLSTRMNLEAQVERLSPAQVSQGRKLVNLILANPDKSMEATKQGHSILKKMREMRKAK